jgi:hypothetical protein
VCVLQLCGEYEAKQIDSAVKYMLKEESDKQHYWYGHYYAAHAFHQLGGKMWEDYYGKMKETLIPRQKASGASGSKIWNATTGRPTKHRLRF